MNRMYLLSCEHAGNIVPEGYESLFEPTKDVLSTHKAWDIGALSIAQVISDRLALPLFYQEITRLLVEANRSLNSPQLFSDYTNALSKSQKERIIEQYWMPYRERTGQFISAEIEKGHQVVHLSIHTFTPLWEGKAREVEVGLLYDDELENEAEWCKEFEMELHRESEGLAIRHNEPYHGKADGFTTHLRAVYDPEVYLGIELEINQKYMGEQLEMVSRQLSEALLRQMEKKAT